MDVSHIDPRQLQWAVRVTVGLAVAAFVSQVWYLMGGRVMEVGFLALALSALWFASLMVVMLTAGFGAWRALLTMPVVLGTPVWLILSLGP